MIGSKLQDRYELQEEIGRGGMGVVYRAWDPLLDREVAIKMIPPLHLNRETEERFEREARLVASMDHPAIVPIHDYGHHDGALFFVMPWVRGILLQELVKSRDLTLDEVLQVGIQVAEALDYSHARGVIHRDVKPGNVMVGREGRVLRARVLDFGLARSATEGRLTKTGGLVGTLANLSPELVAGGEVDPRSDVYALGTVLYECLVGEPPFVGAVHAVLYRIVHEPPRSLAQRGVECDAELDEVVLRCLAKDPVERPQSGGELAALLVDLRARLGESEKRRTVSTHAVPVPPSLVQPLLSPLVGRQKEWATLRDRLQAALAGECQLVLVEGEAGTGKTRLLEELEALARERGLRVLHGRFVDRERAIPYQGLCDLVRDYFRHAEAMPQEGSSQEGSRGTSVDLSDLAADLASAFPLLAELPGLHTDVPEPPLAKPRPAADPTRLYELLARTLARLGGGRPLVLLLENLHEGDVSLAALTYIVRRLGPTPTLVAGTWRRGEVDAGHALSRLLKSFQDDPRATRIVLSPLPSEDFRRLLEVQLGSAALRRELLDRLWEATEGNPYFGQELVRWLLESGSLTRDSSGYWTLLSDTAFVSEALPATIQQAIERRLERLDEPHRRLLSVASVLGRTFSWDDVQSLAAIDGCDDDLDGALDVLVEEGLLEEDSRSREDLFHFKSGVVRDLLYHELSRRKRRTLHRRYARELEERFPGERRERFYPQLLHHYFEGDVGDKTIRYALEVGKKALAAFSPEDAIRAARTAFELIDEGEASELEGELAELLAEAYRAAGETGKALHEAGRAVDAYGRLGDDAKVAAAALLAAETAWQARRVEAARPWIDRGIGLAQAAGATEVLRRLLTLGATVANLRGEHHRARGYLEEAEKLAAPSPPEGALEAPPRGGTLKAVLPNPVGTVDPAELKTDEEFEVAANVFETLLRTDAEGNLVPALCETWEASADGATVELVLKPDVRFSDGWPLSAADVVASLERAKRGGTLSGAAFGAVREVEVLEGEDGGGRGGERLLFHLVRPLPIFPALLTDPSTAIVRPTRRDDGSPVLVGTGPFRLAEHGAERVVLERNPNYWRGTPPHLDRIELDTALDAAGIAAGLRSGSLDLGRDLLPADLEAFQRDPRFRGSLVEAVKKNVYFLLWNVHGPAARHARLRRILDGVVRVQDLVWRTLGRFAQPAVSFLPPGILGHDPGRRQRPALPREQAKAELEGLGLPRPLVLKAAVHPSFRDRHRALLEALAEEWGHLGVELSNLTPKMEDYVPFWTGRDDADLLIGRWNADFDDPDNFTYQIFHSEAGRAQHFYSSPEADRLIELARREAHAPRRVGYYRRLERLLAEEHALLPLFHDVDYRIAGPRVRRLALVASPPYVDYARLAKQEEARPAQALSEGGELHVALAERPLSLDPLDGNVGEFFEVKANVFETLTRLAEGARVVPHLAAFFEVPGGRSYHFRLREKVRFHDGRRLTARDVRYTFERLLRNPGSELHFLLLPIAGARELRDGEARGLAGFRILKESELVLELEEPLGFFPALLTHPALGIVPEGTESLAGSWRDGTVGTGPFRVVRFEPGQEADFERNPYYWRPELPRSSRLVFHLGTSPGRASSELRRGHLAVAGDLRPSDVDALKRDPELAAGYQEAPRLSTAFLALNRHQGPFADPAVRHLFAEHLGSAKALAETMPSLALLAHGLIPPGLLGYETPRPGTEDEAQASSSGKGSSAWRNVLAGQKIRVGLHAVFSGQYALLWDELRRRMTDDLGMDVVVADRSLRQLIREERCGGLDLVAMRWIADYPDADAFVMGLLRSREGVLAGLVSSPEVDRLIDHGRRETDPKLRHAIYRELEELLVSERVVIPLFHEQCYRFAHPAVEGLRLGMGLPEVRYEELRPAR